MDVVAIKDRICDGILSLGRTYCEGLQLAALQAAAAMTDKGEDKDMAQYFLSEIQPRSACVQEAAIEWLFNHNCSTSGNKNSIEVSATVGLS